MPDIDDYASGFASLENRSFPAKEGFGAYSECQGWLRDLGCSIGSTQRGAPTAVFFESDAYVSKHRNLGADVANVHGWIAGAAGRFRDCDIDFTITRKGQALLSWLASVHGSSEEPPLGGDPATAPTNTAA